MTIENGYCTLEDIRAWINLSDATDVADDPKLELAVEAVSRRIDQYCERRFYKAPETRVFTPEDDGTLAFVTDLVSATTVRTDDDGDGTFETTWEASSYRLEPRNAAVDGKPYTRIVVAPRATRRFYRNAEIEIAGEFGVPDNCPWLKIVKQATLIQVHRMFKRKDSPFGVAGSAAFGEVTILRPRLDPDVEELLSELLRDKEIVGV